MNNQKSLGSIVVTGILSGIGLGIGFFIVNAIVKEAQKAKKA